MKICMIGDSHLAMMINAHKQQKTPGLDLMPVSWPRQYFDQLSLEGSEFCAGGPELRADWKMLGLPQRINLASFDQVVFVSYTVTAFHAFVLLRDFAVSDWRDAEFLIKRLNSPIGSPGDRRLITPALFKACLAGMIRDNSTFGFVDHLRKHSDVPIVIVPAPYLAEHTLKHRLRMWGLRQVLRKHDGAALADCLHEAHELAFAPFENLRILRQPAETVIRGCLTRETYREGAARMVSGDAHNADDILHAGPRLGALLLRDICGFDAAAPKV